MAPIVGAGLLASAFAPLVLVLAMLRLGELGVWGWLLIGASLLSMLLLVGVLRTAARIQVHSVEVTAVRRADERVLSFTASYVVPAVVVLFGGKDWLTGLATGVLLVLLALIYVRGGLYHLNPTLAIAGYRLYELTERSGKHTMLLTRADHLPQQGHVIYRRLAADAAVQLRGDP